MGMVAGRLARIAALMLGGLALMVATALLFLSTSPGERLVVREGLKAANRALRGSMRAERLDLQGSRVVIEGLELRDPEGALVARIERVEARIGLFSLLRNRIHLTEAKVTRPELFLRRDERGLNLSRAVEGRAPAKDDGKPSESQLTLALEKLQLVDGSLQLLSETPSRSELSLAKIQAEGRLTYHAGEKSLEAGVRVGGEVHQPVQAPLSISAEATFVGPSQKADLTLSLGDTKARAGLHRVGTETLRAVISELHLPPAIARAVLSEWPIQVPVSATGEISRTGSLAEARLALVAGGARIELSGGFDLVQLEARNLRVLAKGVDFNELLPKGPKSNLGLDLLVDGGGRSVETLEGTLSLSVPQSHLENHVVGPLRLTAAARAGRITISELSGRLPGLSLQVHGEGTPKRISLAGRLAASDLRLLGRAVGRAIGRRPLPLSGRGAFQVKVDGPLTHPGVALDGSFSAFTFASYSLHGLEVRASIPDILKPLEAQGTLQVRQLSFGERRFRNVRASLQTNGRALTADLSTQGLANLVLHLAGTLDPSGEVLDISELALRYPEAEWTLVAPTRLSFGGGALRLQSLALASGDQRLELSAALLPRTIDATVRLSALDVSRLPAALIDPKLGLKGRLSAEIRAHGRKAQPVLEGRLSWKDGGLGQLTQISLDAQTTYQRERAHGKLALTAPLAALHGSFDLPVGNRHSADPVSLELALRDGRLETALAAAGLRPLSGTFSGEVALSGTVGDPKLLATVRAKHEGVSLALAGQTSPDGTLSIRLEADVGAPAGPSFVLVHSPLTLRAFLGPRPPSIASAPFEVEGHLRFPLRRLKELGLFERDLPGDLEARLVGRGPLSAPSGSLRAQLTQTRLGAGAPFDATVDFEAGREGLRLGALAQRKAEPLASLKAQLAVAPQHLTDIEALGSAPLALTLAVERFALHELRSLGSGLDEAPRSRPLNGLFSANLTATGTLGAPRVTLSSRLEEVGVGQTNLGKAKLDYRYADTQSELLLQVSSASGGTMRLDGSTRVDLGLPALRRGLRLRDAPLRTQLKAERFDLSMAAGATPSLRSLGGLLQADAMVTGTFGRPVLRGEIAWQDGRLGLVGFGEYQEIDLQLHVTHEQIALRRLFAKAGRGSLELSGGADRAGDRFALRGQGRLRDFPLVVDDQLLAILSLRTDLSGTIHPRQVTIGVQLPEAHLNLPEVRRKDLQDLDRPNDILLVRNGRPIGRRREAKEPRQSGGPSQAPRKYLVLVNAPRNLWVNGTDVHAELGLSEDFRIELVEELLMYGDVRFVRGRVDVLGRRFDLEKDSQVRFAGPPKVPYVNLTATHINEREQVTVFVNIVGQGKDVSLKPTSQPQLSESEIYTLLATGRRSLKRGSGASMTGAQAASVLGALAASQLKKTLSAKLPLDVLSIEAGEEGLAGARLEAGRYITDKIYVGYTGQLAADPALGENSNAVQLEYQFGPRWSFELEYGDAKAGGADFIWSRDY